MLFLQELPVSDQASRSSMNLPTTYRHLVTADFPAAHRLSQAVRWPHRLEDWQFAANLGTGFIAEMNGEVVGTALCWTFDDHNGALGLVIVSPDAQGRGIGRDLMTRVLNAVGERTCYLHATPAGQPLYEKLGFQACGSVTQHQNIVGRITAVAPAQGETLREGTVDDLSRIIEIARISTGIDHSATFAALYRLAKTVVLERNGNIIGSAFFRRFGRGYVIGPVFAEQDTDDRRAKVLISYWLARHEGDFIRVDVPGNPTLSAWLIECGLANVDTGVKMVRHAGKSHAASRPAETVYAHYAILNQAMG